MNPKQAPHPVDTNLKIAQFGTVKISDWFKESPEGAWYLKTGSNKGLYKANGVTGEPLFLADENVFVPVDQ